MELALKETEQILSKRLYATCSLCGHYEIPDISDSHPCCSYPCPAVCCYRSVLTNQVASSVSQSMTLVSPAETAEPIEMPFGLRIRVGPKNHGVQITPCEGTIFRGKGMTGHARRHSMPRAVQKWLSWSRCRLGCGPRKRVLGGMHSSATWWIPMNWPCAAAMRSFCQITWPLVTLFSNSVINNVFW